MDVFRKADNTRHSAKNAGNCDIGEHAVTRFSVANGANCCIYSRVANLRQAREGKSDAHAAARTPNSKCEGLATEKVKGGVRVNKNQKQKIKAKAAPLKSKGGHAAKRLLREDVDAQKLRSDPSFPMLARDEHPDRMLTSRIRRPSW
jgi:hypothetical protein